MNKSEYVSKKGEIVEFLGYEVVKVGSEIISQHQFVDRVLAGEIKVK